MTAHKPGDPTTLNRLYGRAKGKPLRAGQQDLVDRLLPQISVPAEGPVTAQALFGFDRPLHFEIGFGGGEHMAARADMLPDHGFIGAEPFLNGVAQALVHIRDAALANVRVHMGDALEVLHPGGNATLRLAQMRDARGQPVDVAQGSPVRVWIPLPAGYAGGMLVRLYGE